LTENIKLENCRYNKDVIYAMFKEINSDETEPYSIHQVPGIIYATDYDLGAYQKSWYDWDIANYNGTTGQYTAWNSGWEYRNDGIDIEKSTDNHNSNGFDVGWTNNGEWMQYTLSVDTAGYYYVDARVASNGSGGQFYLLKNEIPLFDPVTVQGTQGWQNWTSVLSPIFYLDKGIQTLRFYFVTGGFNLGGMEFKFLNISGLEPEDVSSFLTVYPNPNHGRFLIKPKFSFPPDSYFAVADPEGKTVYPLTQLRGNNPADIDMTNSKTGIYIAILTIKGKAYYSKISLQR
jgi:hypothetical protein